MRNIELSITPTYVNWELWQGIREFIQNAKDADTKGFYGCVSFDQENCSLNIMTEGISLGRESLLLGSGTKKNDKTQIGGYGEGYKLAIATLLRLGKGIVIHTNKEQWIPSISYSDTFESNVISIDIVPDDHPEWNTSPGYVRIEITDLSIDEWEDVEVKFLFLERSTDVKGSREYNFNDEVVDSIHSSEQGDIINQGHTSTPSLYVKGIYVAELPRHDEGGWRYSYNLNRLAVDRDRTIYSDWDFKCEVLLIAEHFAENDPVAFMEAFPVALLEEGSPSLYMMASMASRNSSCVRVFCRAFYEEYGANAFPHYMDRDEERIRLIGREPIRLNTWGSVLLCRAFGEVSELVLSHKRDSTDVDPASLSDEEFSNWEYVIAKTRGITMREGVKFELVDFVMKGEVDAYCAEDSHLVQIGRHLLSSKKHLLAAAIRESRLVGFVTSQPEYAASIANILAEMVVEAEECQLPMT